jgi:hypothetical protein
MTRRITSGTIITTTTSVITITTTAGITADGRTGAHILAR